MNYRFLAGWLLTVSSSVIMSMHEQLPTTLEWQQILAQAKKETEEQQKNEIARKIDEFNILVKNYIKQLGTSDTLTFGKLVHEFNEQERSDFGFRVCDYQKKYICDATGYNCPPATLRYLDLPDCWSTNFGIFAIASDPTINHAEITKFAKYSLMHHKQLLDVVIKASELQVLQNEKSLSLYLFWGTNINDGIVELKTTNQKKGIAQCIITTSCRALKYNQVTHATMHEEKEMMDSIAEMLKKPSMKSFLEKLCNKDLISARQVFESVEVSLPKNVWCILGFMKTK